MSDNRKHYAVELIESTIFGLNRETAVPQGHQVETIVRAFLPYCLESIGDDQYLPLNRFYKPLGLSGNSDTANYGSLKYAHLRIAVADLDMRFLYGSVGRRCYFFNDGDSPYCRASKVDRAAYLCRLWLTFRALGMHQPKIDSSHWGSVSKRLGMSPCALVDLLQGILA